MVPPNMKALIKPSRAPGFELTQVATPRAREHEVLIQVKAASICGSDLPIYHWDDPWVRHTVQPGQIVGHEFCGLVVECGEHVQKVAVGDFVTAEGHLNCGGCSHCRRGEAHVCPNLRLVGFDHPGAFAEYVAIPASNVIRLNSLPLVIGAILDPFGNAVHAATRVSLTNQVILITGCGPLGLMAIALAKFSGAHRIIATDVSDYRLELAQQMGADLALNVRHTDWKTAVNQECRLDHGVDVHIEMSGSSQAIVDGFELIRPGGNAILMGLPKQPVFFDFANLLIAKGITARGLVGRRMYETWNYALRLLGWSDCPGTIDLRPIVTHRFMLQDYDKAMALIDAGECGKVVLFMDKESLRRSYEEVPA